MKFNVKGFTLVELLAVIVILAVILVITIPGIGKLIDISTRSAFENDAKMLLKAAELKITESKTFDPLSIDETNIEEELNVSSSNYEKITFRKVNGKLYVTIIGKNKWKNLTVSGTRQKISVYDTTSNVVRGVNVPVLAKGMTPIKWNGADWIETTEDDEEWHNYDNKIWANARTKEGSMWVWIPRYIYKVTSGWHSNATGTIEVKFSRGVDDTIDGTISITNTGKATDSDGMWTNHPAFTFGNTELTGIWVAKFEATAAEGVANYYTSDTKCSNNEDNVVNKTIKSVPNAISWRCIEPDYVFKNVRNMETNSVYGWVTASGLKKDGTFENDNNGVDTHLMKNTEWGAVAYLSKSKYGKNAEEIWVNNDKNYTTGCAANKASQGENDGCLNTYETPNGVKASTTGNIYGIYDMSGGAWERVSAYLNNNNSNLLSGASLVNAESKYKNVYSVGEIDDQISNYALTNNTKGDSLYETSNSHVGSYAWFTDYSNMPVFSSMWFNRGGCTADGSGAGIFNFRYTHASMLSSIGFRPVLLVNQGL